MAIIRNSITQVLVRPGTIFNAKITTPKIKMDNFQAAHFNIISGDGATKTLTAQIYGAREGKESIMLREAEITIGGNTDTIIVVAARELCHHELDSAYLVIPNGQAADKLGTIFAVLTNERYAEG